MNRSDLGYFAEHYVAQYLEAKGYEIMDLNFRKPWGEIDIVVQKEGILVFVEVKASKQATAGFEPELRAGSDKMRKVVRTARTYLAYSKYPPDKEWQVDIVSLTFDKDRGVAQIKHFKNVEV